MGFHINKHLKRVFTPSGSILQIKKNSFKVRFQMNPLSDRAAIYFHVTFICVSSFDIQLCFAKRLPAKVSSPASCWIIHHSSSILLDRGEGDWKVELQNITFFHLLKFFLRVQRSIMSPLAMAAMNKTPAGCKTLGDFLHLCRLLMLLFFFFLSSG